MAKIKTVIGEIRGRVGNKIYSYSAKHGQRVRDRRPIDKEAFQHDPKYKHLRENCSEFGRASSAAKLMKQALGDLLWQKKDMDINGGLISRMVEVIKSDKISDPGLRKPEHGNLDWFEGFEFNRNASFGTRVIRKDSISIDREGGLLDIDFPSFKLKELLKVPKKAEFFRIVSAGLALDFENKKYESDSKCSEWMPISLPTPEIMLSNTISPKTKLSLFLIAGIEYRDRWHWELDDGLRNLLAIVKVEQYG